MTTMGATPKEQKTTKRRFSSDKVKDLEVECKSSGFFRTNGWKATLVIVLFSLILRATIRTKKVPHDENLPYASDDEPFLELVSEKYPESDLYEWTPAPKPISKPEEHGDMGSAVVVPNKLKEEAKTRFTEHQFDIIANEMMSVNRSLADSRYPECLSVEYPKKLPQVSVVIVYHNEAWSTLTRTVWSVITQSPKELLKEIILVDDFSTKDYLIGPELPDYMKTVPVPVILARTPSRVGLIQARLLGAKKASAKVMVFLDAHCECNQGWLEPLLAPIANNRKTVTTPVIDVIDYDTMAIRTAVVDTRGSFDLGLSFTWDRIPKRFLGKLHSDRTAPIMAPAMAGGLFAIDREYFYELGSYDEKMKIWGGENLEMSVRIWTCGGNLLTIPCSRVGHIFRQASPYELPGGASHVIQHNLARMVDVWFDDYKDIYYAMTPEAVNDRTNVTERKILRKNLKCKSFRWYLQNVFPESPFNLENYRLGEIESIYENDMCLDSMGPSRVENRELKVMKCHKQGGNQMFMLTENNEVREKKYCLDATRPGKPVEMLNCHGEGGNQRWVYDEDTMELKHRNGRNCLTLPDESDLITIDVCDGSAAQQWDFREAISTAD